VVAPEGFDEAGNASTSAPTTQPLKNPFPKTLTQVSRQMAAFTETGTRGTAALAWHYWTLLRTWVAAFLLSVLAFGSLLRLLF
jgi:hypothetical protein